MKANSYFINNAWICQIYDSKIKPVFGDLHIKDGKIEQVKEKDPESFLNSPLSAEQSGQAYDVRGKVITAPMVNFHDHFYSRLAKGLPISGSMEDFPHILQNMWWKLDLLLDKPMVEASAEMAGLEAIKNGVTYVFDHHVSPAVTEGSLESIAEVIQNFNIQAVLCFETSDRNGEILKEQALNENLRFLQNHQNGNIRGMMGLHASFTLDDDTLIAAGKLIEESDTGIHIHLCEDKADALQSLKKYGKHPVNRLQDAGLLIDKSLLVHGVHLEAEHYEKIGKSGSALVYNPDSNMNNAVGLPLYKNVPSSIPILAGTDGMHMNMAKGLKQLFLLYRQQQNSFEETFEWLDKIFFDQITYVRKYFPYYPGLLPGDRADLIVWDYIPPTPFSESNIWGHFIYGLLESSVSTVMNSGNYLMKEHRLESVDENHIRQKIREQGKRLYKKFLSE